MAPLVSSGFLGFFKRLPTAVVQMQSQPVKFLTTVSVKSHVHVHGVRIPANDEFILPLVIT